MDEKGLRELLLQRLHMELLLFKDSMLQKEKEDIFMDSYRIEIYVNLYEILLVHTENLQCGMIRGLLALNSGILDHLYREWLDREDSFYVELKEYACGELEVMPGKINPGAKKEGEHGTEPDQAA